MQRIRSVSATRVIATTPARIFDVLADPRQHPLLDGSGTVVNVRRAPERLFLGATFAMDMNNRISYLTRNKVVVFEENKAIAWHHWAQFVWRYDLEAVPEGTRVTESFAYDKPWAFVIILLGWPERNRLGMEATLQRIEQLLKA